MASPPMKTEQSFDFWEAGAQDAMGSASESSYSPPGGGVFGLSPPESSPRGGRNNRRRDRPSWVKHTYTPFLDGHLWRKYGQKNIKDAEYPRLYYRCSYRSDRQCLAAKLLQQKNDEDPPLYEVTYTYEHTCGAPPVPFPDIVDEPPAAREGVVLRFDSPGGHGGDAQAPQQPGQYQSSSQSPFMMLNFGSSSQAHEQQPFFGSDLAAGSSSSSFPAAEGLPAAPSGNGDGDMYPTWDSFTYDFKSHMHFGDHAHSPYSSNYNDDNY